MAPRIRMQIVADGDPVTTPTAGPGRFHTLLIVEGVPTGDERLFAEGSLSWRDLPLPLMAIDKTTYEHLDAILIGNIDTIERRETELHGWGSYLSAPGEEAARLIALIEAGELRGVSADVDSVEYEVLFPMESTDATEKPDNEDNETGDAEADLEAELAEMDEPAALPRETGEDGQEYEVLKVVNPRMRVTDGRLMGATVVPFPAFQEAFIEADGELVALAASGAAGHVTGFVLLAAGAATGLPAREAHPARFTFPDLPPVGWFEVPETPGPMPLTILDSGQVFGHLAVWGECHIGIGGECVQPPASQSNYARFHVGEVPCVDGERVSTGRLTFATGHADTRLGPDDTRAHYDHTGTVAADIVASDGEHGIWVCGAVRSTLTTAQVREVMASPPSGDWRRFGRGLELVGALCVNVPGFNTPRQLAASGESTGSLERSWARVRKDDGLVASLIVSHPARPVAGRAAAAVDPVLAARLRDRIAATIGRSRSDRVAALAARVHGGN